MRNPFFQKTYLLKILISFFFLFMAGCLPLHTLSLKDVIRNGIQAARNRFLSLVCHFSTNNNAETEPVSAVERLHVEFTASCLYPRLGEAVSFTALSEGDAGADRLYQWDFDDGTTATGIQVSHSFPAAGSYRVVLKVTSENNESGSQSKWLFPGRPAGWTFTTHQKKNSGAYEQLFDDSRVQRIDISIAPAAYQAMEDDLRNIPEESGRNPIYAPVTIKYNSQTWYYVGMRYKGNSTLKLALKQGHKLPFRLKFNHYAKTHPEISGQRFYGFKEMTFANNFYDPSFLREKVCADLFRNAGIPAARTTFCRVYVDKGDGAVYWGLYTMIEDPSDQMIRTQFADGKGNLYKPEGEAARCTFFDREAFVKVNHKKAADYSDIQAFLGALHAARDDAAAWRAELEKVFDVPSFIRWLAVNTALVNWDSYGTLPHNYYLYQNPADNGRLVWIPWDLNHSLNTDNRFGNGFLTLALNDVRTDWPLIRYLMDDPFYCEYYHNELNRALECCINETVVLPYLEKLYQLIRPFIVGEEGEGKGYTYLSGGAAEWEQAYRSLVRHVKILNTALRNYLNSRR